MSLADIHAVATRTHSTAPQWSAPRKTLISSTRAWWTVSAVMRRCRWTTTVRSGVPSTSSRLSAPWTSWLLIVGAGQVSRAPAEIALSILAEVVAVRNGVLLRQKKEGSSLPHDTRRGAILA